MFTLGRRVLITSKQVPDNKFDRKTRIKTTLRTKLKKALQYCDNTKDDEISEACKTLWKEIDELHTNIQDD
jgi:ribosomal protein S20